MFSDNLWFESSQPNCPVPEFIDPVFAKTSPKGSFSLIENKRFGLVFAKIGSINSGTVVTATNKKHFSTEPVSFLFC
jgi:hypothetical protein